MDNMKDLWEIQVLEQEKAVMERKLKTIPEVKQLKKLKGEIEDEQYRIQGIRDELLSLKKKLRIEETSIAALKDKIAEANKLLYSGEITNTKELASAEKNIETYLEKARQTEEKEIEIMESMEAMEGNVSKLMKDLEEKKTLFRQINQGYVTQKTSIQKAIEEAASKIQILTDKIAPVIMQQYLTLCEKFDDKKGVALLTNGVCSGCHMGVSFDLIRQSRNPLAEIKCDNCGRMLVPE